MVTSPARLGGFLDSLHPFLDFVRRRQDHRHHFRMDGADLGVRIRREERGLTSRGRFPRKALGLIRTGKPGRVLYKPTAVVC